MGSAPTALHAPCDTHFAIVASNNHRQAMIARKNDLLLAPLALPGPAPHTLCAATAAGAAGNTFSPLGVGTGAAGAGGGDTTISAN